MESRLPLQLRFLGLDFKCCGLLNEQVIRHQQIHLFGRAHRFFYPSFYRSYKVLECKEGQEMCPFNTITTHSTAHREESSYFADVAGHIHNCQTLQCGKYCNVGRSAKSSISPSVVFRLTTLLQQEARRMHVINLAQRYDAIQKLLVSFLWNLKYFEAVRTEIPPYYFLLPLWKPLESECKEEVNYSSCPPRGVNELQRWRLSSCLRHTAEGGLASKEVIWSVRFIFCMVV